MQKKNEAEHPFLPVYDKNCHTLILGSFPSPASRASGFYYGHPRNRFWQMLSTVFNEPAPRGNAEKRDFLLSRGLALWDVLASCEISGASDSSIQNPVPNDLFFLLGKCEIKKVLLNGGKAFELYRKYFPASPPAFKLPSTSPANAAWGVERLSEAWSPCLKNDGEPFLQG